MEGFFFGLVAMVVMSVPSYAIEKEKGFFWAIKTCSLLGAFFGFVYGVANYSSGQPFEPLILAFSYGAISFFGGIPMYFWVDTCKDLEREKAKTNGKEGHDVF
ncbi:MAG: hypothetical protein Q4B17_09535 [Lautropia sp.]|nr:hypothetical protein [Lautropia sp.]